MSTEIYLGEPPPRVKEWIRKHHKQDQFNFLYKKEGDAVWQEYMPTENDIQLINGKATIAATDFKEMEGFADVREVKLPNKWNNGSEVVDVTDIDAFEECYNLTSVTIPDSVNTIKSFAFFGCSKLTSVTIPASVTSIKNSAFETCQKLTSVTFKGDAPMVGNLAFSDVAIGCKAVISSTATGFPTAGETWNGLIVEVKS